MRTLRGNKILLRALEPEDIDILYRIENDEDLWSLSETLVPFSKHTLKEYIANAHLDIFETKQLRLVICDLGTGDVIGLVDLFDFDPLHLRAGLGIVIASNEDKRKGFASEAIKVVKGYCATHLKMHQLYANIDEENKPSRALFEKSGFDLIGIKKDWRRKYGVSKGKRSFTNELMYQHIL